MDIGKRRNLKHKGQMILKDPSDDYPWLALTLGPSERAVEEYRRMNKMEEEVGEQGVHKTRIHLTLVDPSDDIPQLQLTLGRVRKTYCLYCGGPRYNRQAYGGHMGQCKNQPSCGPQKFFCEWCAKDFPSLRAVFGHMGSCEMRD